MTILLDLNASPLPDDEADIFQERVEERVKTALQIYNREREERRKRLKREYPDERQKLVVQPPKQNPVVQTRNKLPPGWLDCPPYGEVIGYIIPSKVPLSESFYDCIDPGNRYSFRQLIRQQRVLKKELGLVIDLTYSNRYYSPSDWIEQGIKHVKIPCVGRDSVPDKASVNRFVYEVSTHDAEDPSEYSGKIIECSWDSQERVWVFMHIRTDRSTPKDLYTYLKVMSITDNITEQVLLNEIGENVRLPMYANRIRNDREAHRLQLRK